MSAFLRALRAPGAMPEVIAGAPTQYPDNSPLKPTDNDSEILKNVTGYTVQKKAGFLDRQLDHIVHASGSIPTFLFIQALLVVWAFLGIPFNQTDIWPIIISNAQAIFSYIFDSFLMRQQLNGYSENLLVLAELKSRNATNKRLLESLLVGKEKMSTDLVALTEAKPLPAIEPPKEGLFSRFVTFTAKVVGHLWFVIFYWAAMFLWLGFGPMNEWSNQWQLDINSATSAMMVFTFSFLAILREQHNDTLRARLDSIYRVDASLELKLRSLTNDTTPNEEHVIHALKINPIQRAITYYAEVVGTLVGIALLIIVLIVWVAIGPALQFNANWWLLIGTYAGLVGLNDGFVLRNMQALHRRHEDPLYASLEEEDAQTFRSLGLAAPTAEPVNTKNISYRVSETMNAVCASEITVLLGVMLIFGLLIGASVMRWSETGQLLCNVPPSVIETFFMIILITGHNAADALRRVDLQNVFERRRKLLAFVENAEEYLGRGSVEPKA